MNIIAAGSQQEYDINNGVTADQWLKGMVMAEHYPDGSRCRFHCCGFTFEVFIRAMKLLLRPERPRD